MTFLRLLLYGGLFVTVACSIAKNTNQSLIASNKLDNVVDAVVPRHYDIKLRPYFQEIEENDDIYLKFRPNIKRHQALGRIAFYGDMNATIDILYPITKISLNSSSIMFCLSGELIKRDDTNISHLAEKKICATQVCTLYFKNKVPRGTYILNLKFVNALRIVEDNVIFLKTVYVKTSSREIWSDPPPFETIETQRVFPCWDKPTIKTTFNISVRHHRNYSVFSNTPIRQENIYKRNVKRNTKIQWTHFDTTPPMPAYLVTVMISPMHFFRSIDTDTIYISRNQVSERMQFAQRVLNKIILKLKFEWFKKFKVPQVQFVAIPGLQKNVVNFGLVVMRETNIMYDENLHSVAHKIEVIRLITQAAAYQWFSNLISSFWWSYSWINNGLTILFGIDAANAINALEHYKSSDILNLFIVQTQHESLHLDDYFYSVKSLISEDNNSYQKYSFSSFFHHIKAPLILRTLQHLVTKEVFWKSIHRYFNMNASNLTTLSDFWAVMQAAVNESYSNNKNIKHPNIFVTSLINGYTMYMEYPILKITRNYSANYMDVTIENYFSKKDLIWIPVTFTTQSNLNFMNLAFPLRDERLIFISSYLPFGKQINIIEDGWVMFNLQQIGNYRVNYDFENWNKIGQYLNSEQYTKIHVLNRAQIIDDAFYFTMIQHLKPSMFWYLTNYLAQETDYVAWYPMIKAFEVMSSIFPFPNKGVNNIKEKLNRILHGLLSKINYEENFEEGELTKCLRQEAIKWACVLDNYNCQKTAHDKLSKRIAKLETNKILPWWEEWIYCKGLMIADSQTWHKIKTMTLMQTYSNRFLEFLACRKNVGEYLKLITPQDNGIYAEIQANNSTNSFLFIIAKHAKYNNVLTYILTNFEKLKPRDVSEFAALATIINHVYSKDQLVKIHKATRNIMEKKAFVRNIERFYEENGTDKINIEESFKKYKELIDRWIWYVESKLYVRLSQIKKHVDYFHNFLSSE